MTDEEYDTIFETEREDTAAAEEGDVDLPVWTLVLTILKPGVAYFFFYFSYLPSFLPSLTSIHPVPEPAPFSPLTWHGMALT